MKSRTNLTNDNKGQSTFRSMLGILLFVGIFGYIGFKLVGGLHKQNALEQRTVHIKAIIINERNYFGNSPVTQQFAYSYSFNINGKRYSNNSKDPSLKVGDSIMIEYVPSDPAINQPLNE